MSLAALAAIGILLASSLPLSSRAFAQAGPGGAINPQRDCQTVRSCRFTAGGSYRGCISAYACRICRFVDNRCTVSGREKTCRQLVCNWGA